MTESRGYLGPTAVGEAAGGRRDPLAVAGWPERQVVDASRVLVVGAPALVGGALGAFLERTAGVEVDVASIASWPRAMVRNAPGTCLLSADGRDDTLAATLQGIRRACPAVRIYLLDSGYRKGTRRLAGRAGAAGVITLDCDLLRFAEAMTSPGSRSVGSGRPGRRLAAALAPEPRGRTRPDWSPIADLTERESQILERLVEADSPPEIADLLGISPNTVRTHLQNLMAKLGVHSRLEAVALAREHSRRQSGMRELSQEPLTEEVDSPGRSPNIVVAGGPALLRAGLAAALEAGPLHGPVTTFDADGELLSAIRPLLPAVVVLAGPAKLQRCASLKAAGFAVRVLVLHDRPERQMLSAAIEVGADGFVTYDLEIGDFIEATRRVADGNAFVPDNMLGLLLRDLIDRRRSTARAMSRVARLSRQERRVLGMLAQGLDDAEIAEALTVSLHTARTHGQNILKKLEVHSRVEAVALAAALDGEGGFDEQAPASVGEERGA